MDSAKRSLETGQLDWAMLHLQAAESWLLVGGYETSAELHRLYGAYYQRKGDYNEADVHFAWALSIAETNLQRGMILRDWALLSLDRKEYGRAEEQIGEAMTLLLPSEKTHPEDEATRHNAYAVGKSVHGRLKLAMAMGNKSGADYEEALCSLLVADCLLRGERGRDLDELENLIWLLKVLPFFERRTARQRALRLARKIGRHDYVLQLSAWERWLNP